MIERAEKVADGTRPLKQDRFVKLQGTQRSVNWALVARARQLAGLKGYADGTVMPRTGWSFLVALGCETAASA